MQHAEGGMGDKEILPASIASTMNDKRRERYPNSDARWKSHTRSCRITSVSRIF